jgi:tetratricopeptide (TPR) repeat protein
MKKIFVSIALALLAFGLAATAVCQEDPLKTKVVEIEKAYIAGNLSPTIAKYDALANENPKDPVSHYLLGIAYLYADFNKENATFDKAYDELIKSKELDPKMKYVNYSLGYILWARGEYDKAIESYKAEIAGDPNSAGNYYNLGQSYEALKQWDKALSQYIMAIDKDPKMAKAYNNLGAVYMNWKGDYFKALDNFKTAVELKPNIRLYKENYNMAVKKLKGLKESLDKGQTHLPPETVEKLRKIELKEIEIGTEGT